MDAVKIPQNYPEKTGLSGPNSAHGEPESPLKSGLSGQDLVELKVLWSKAYKRDLTEHEVLEIYGNVKHLVETLI